jgi:hypothetical protein
MQDLPRGSAKAEILEALRHRIAEDEARLKFEFFRKPHPKPQIIEFVAKLFEISAHWNLQTVLSYDGAAEFEAYLRDELLASTIQAAEQMMESWPEREVYLSEIRTGLLVRIAHWRAVALERAREGKLRLQGPAAVGGYPTQRIAKGAMPEDQFGDPAAVDSNGANPSAGRTRLQATVTSLDAAHCMEAYMQSKGIGQTEFAVQVGTTDRTLRSFRKTGKVRRDIFDAIAKAIGTTREALLKSE